MKVLYTIAGFYRAAGMERILADKANYLAGCGYAVVIVTTDQRGREEVFPLDPSITHIDLGIGYEDNNGGSLLSKVLYYPLKKWMHRRRLKLVLGEERPDITVSMFCGDEGFLPRLPHCGKTVLEVHFSRFKRLQYGRRGLWALADRWRSWKDGRVIRKFDRFVALTREDLGYWGTPANGCVIPNFIGSMPVVSASLESRTVLAVGRYSYQKGFERLLEAWALAVKQLPSRHGWKLRLVGDGENRRSLQSISDSLGISSSVRIDCPQKDMDIVYRDSSILALSSRYEGLPMVLLEAQAYGIPCVCFDCKCGPRDVITDGEDGYLVPEGDVQALAYALVKLVKDPSLRAAMGRKARRQSARWDKESIMQQWLTLFNDISLYRL